MTRLFLRFYAGIMLGFVVTMAVVVGWLLAETPQDRQIVEHSLRGGISLADEKLTGLSSPALDRELASLTESFGYPVYLKTLEQLDVELATLLRGRAEPVFAGVHLYLERRSGDGSVLVMGPLPDFSVGGGLSGLKVLAFVVIVWALVALLLLRPLFRSFTHLERTAQKMADGDLSARLDPRLVALDTLAQSFNSMAETTEKLITDQRDLLAAVSHEFRTPLARLRFACEMSERPQSPGQRATLVAGMDADIMELEALVVELLDYIRLGYDNPPQQELFRPRLVIAELVSALERGAVTLSFVDEVDDDQTSLRGRRLFQRTIKNLIGNAMRFAVATVVVRLEQRTDADVWVIVSDDGPGIAVAERARVLQPFVQLDPQSAHPGSGLGLAIVARIVEDFGGEVVIGDSEGGGASVSIRWPVASVGESSRSSVDRN